MGQSKYRKQLNKVLVNYVNRTQPLLEKYEEQYNGCRGYVCILLRARRFREFKVAPRIVSYLLYMYTIRP